MIVSLAISSANLDNLFHCPQCGSMSDRLIGGANVKENRTLDI